MTCLGLIVLVMLCGRLGRRMMHFHERGRRRDDETERDTESSADSWCGSGTWGWGGAGACGSPRRRGRERHRERDERERGKQSEGQKTPRTPEEEALRRARRRAQAEVGFYTHLTSYVCVIGFLALINLFTSPRYPWFLWPAMGWGFGILSHFMGVFGSRMLRERFFDPIVEREVRKERTVLQTEKQQSIDELSSTIAHEIRNPIAAAKSLLQQMGEDPGSVENVEYANVAINELERVEKSISHLLKYAKEEDYDFKLVNLATVLDSALTQMRAKLDTAKVAVARNYIGGPTVSADADKLRQVFTNIIDNAIDALAVVPENRRLELFIENGRTGVATVRVRDNGNGITPQAAEKVFNPFFTTKDHGTGLGMAISKKIVEAHEGTIELSSRVGQGTELRVELPLPARS